MEILKGEEIMCLIVHSDVSDYSYLLDNQKILDGIADRNPDGFGVMYQVNGVTKSSKGLVSKGTIRKIIEKIHNSSPNPSFLHWRLATSGKVDKDNSHPFEIGENTFIAHNGVLGKEYQPKGDDRNDTRVFLDKEMLGKEKLIFDKAFKKDIEAKLGNKNKLAIMSGDKYTIYNRGKGIEYEDLWFSNTYAWDYPKSLKWKDNFMDWKDYDIIEMDGFVRDNPTVVSDFLYDYGITLKDLEDYKNELQYNS